MARELVSDVLRRNLSTVTPSEQRIVRVLLGDYPRAGLESAARLARRASSSAPTVVRLMPKLGFSGYPDLQERLRAELAERATSPLDQYQERRPGSAVSEAASTLLGAVQETLEGVPPHLIGQAAEMIRNERHRLLIGGRFSSTLATYLAGHLQLLLPRVRVVPLEPMGRTSAVLDVGPRAVVVAYDFRRYQDDTVAFCVQARRQGARVILFTDPWLSPAAEHADIVLPCSVTAACPFDSVTAALALTEVLIAAVVDQMGDEPRKRLARFEDSQLPWG